MPSVRAQLSRTNKSAEAVSEIRRRIEEDYQNNPDLYDQFDIERIRKNDWYVKRFLLARGRNVDAAFSMLRETLRWRKEMELPTMKDSDFPMEFFKAGGLFDYERDINGNVMIYMRIRMHRKIPELADPMKKFVMHIVNKVDMMTDGQGMAIVFDCTGAGYTNADMDFLTFLINSGKNHFPLGAKYILVYELPWILNAFWRMAAAVLPAELMGLIKFATKKDITNYVAEDNLPDYMGGRCKRNYRYVPPGCKSVKEIAIEHGYSEDDVARIMPMYEPLLKEAEEALAKGDWYDPVDVSPRAIEAPSAQPEVTLTPMEGEDMSLQYASMTSIDMGEHGPILRMLPSDVVQFEYDKNLGQFVAAITIYNTTSRPVAFKVQSNRPQAYSVSPRLGILLEGGALTLHLRLLTNCDHDQRDKFLILARCIETVKISQADFAKLWKPAPSNAVSAFKLSSIINRHSRTNGFVSGGMMDAHDAGRPAAGETLSQQVSQLRIKMEKLERRQRSTELLVYFIMLLLFGLIAFVILPLYLNANESQTMIAGVNLASIGKRLRQSMDQRQG